MVKEILYHYKGDTNSDCVYVTIDEDSMAYLIKRATILLAMYAELTATPKGDFVATERNATNFGKRGKTTIGSFKANSRLSLLGGLISNYYTKQSAFKNDISEGQIPFILSVMNECNVELNEPTLEFKNKLFD